MDYNKTLNLPKTDFPMRASLSAREPSRIPSILESYHKLMELNKSKPPFILHDGPPFSNNSIHAGHALNKILKDIIIRYKNMSGHYSPMIPGWDNHGMPIETAIIKKQKLDLDKMSIPEFRDACKDFAQKFVDIQKEQFIRLGLLGDWDNPYLTMSPDFEAREIKIFGEMFQKGLIYKGLKPVYWCTGDRTALAEAEVEYKDDECRSIYVKFPVKDSKGKFDIANTFFLIWTTTTWTLPGNTAICLHPSLEYSLIEVGTERYILATSLIESTAKAAGWETYKTLSTFKGAELEHMLASHPFLDRESLIINGLHVTDASGTGCVHTAPGHGADDYSVGLKYSLPMPVPVNERGIMTDEAGEVCAGLRYNKANDAILEHLKKANLLLCEETITHTYPHCWRCNNPIIFRATPQWFASVEKIKDAACAEVEKARWLPAWGKDRMLSMVRERNDWCISRQRHWGLPIPVFYCETCEKPICTPETINQVSGIFKAQGSNAWYQKSAAELLPDNFTCPHCKTGKTFTAETDTLDGWFDSGSSHDAVMQRDDELRHKTWDLRWPADLYIEGNDQFRGWFQSSLLTAVATGNGASPYRAVVACGMVLDGEGRKMSKSLGNGIDPGDICKQSGADILRLWVAYSDYQSDVKFSHEILKQLGDIYLKIRNTCRFLLGNIYDYNQDRPGSVLSDLDRWALHRLEELRMKVIDAYEDYEFHLIPHAIHNFCVIDMSSFYLDIVKDTLYCEKPKSPERIAIQSVLHKTLDALTRLIAPLFAFTSEEIWEAAGQSGSPLFAGMPEPVIRSYISGACDLIFEEVRPIVNKALEDARAEKIIGKPLEAAVNLTLDEKLYGELKDKTELLAKCFIVSALSLEKGNEISAEITRAEGEKCERCWGYFKNLGADEKHPTLCARCAEAVS